MKTCPYAGNRFCASLSGDHCSALCGHCATQLLRKGTQFGMGDLRDSFVVLCAGLAVVCESDPAQDGRVITSGIISSGEIMSLGNLLDLPGNLQRRHILCLMDCRIARIDPRCVRRLFDTDAAFVRTIMQNIILCCVSEKNEMMAAAVLKDARESVRYVLRYCQKHRIPQLTHQQIAIICNRRRATVTTILHELLLREPELFRPEDGRD